jgi:hypothetical protein
MQARDEERARRLAAALRDNLRRRKAQARKLAQGSVSPAAKEADAETGNHDT